MDLLLEGALHLLSAAGGGFAALLAVRWRKRMPRVDAALEQLGIVPDPGIDYALFDDPAHVHIYDRVINDGRGWKCKCGAKAGKK